MKLNTKIRIIFLVAILFIVAFFALLFAIDKTIQGHHAKKRYSQSAFLIEQNLGKLTNDIELYLLENGFQVVENSDKILQSSTIIHERTIAKGRAFMLKEGKLSYLLVRSKNTSILLKDIQKDANDIYILAGFSISFLFLILLYLWLMRSLMPLKLLENQINEVAKGNLNIRTTSKKTDEIGNIANTFDNALQKIDSLISSRQLFLRTIMHELKTPIAKGRLLGEFIDDKSLAQNYESVFERLELLLEEFQKIEQLLSLQYTIKQSKYQAQDIIDQAVELLILEPHEIKKHITFDINSKLILFTDFNLLSVALKNLILNAINYSSDNHVTVSINDNCIIVSNNAQPLSNIEEYFLPFNPKAKGSGLGLYIVKNIVDMLGYKLSYTSEDGINYFTIMT